MKQKSVKVNTVYNTIKTCMAVIFPLITFPYASRVLLPDNVGKINFGRSIVSYFSLIASLGIATYAIRECAAVREDKKKLSNIASQIYSINIITTIIAYIGIIFALLFYNKLDNYKLLIIVQSLSILTTTLGADWLNSAMEDFKYITIRTVLFNIASMVLMFIFVRQPEDYMKYVLISLVSSSGASICNIWYRRKYCKVSFIKDFLHGIEWKRHITPIVFLFVMIMAQTIFNNLDISMIGIIRDDREVGIYTTAHKIMNLINQLVASICWVIMPRMSLYFEKKDYKEINTLLSKVFALYMTIGLPCIVGTFMLSSDIIYVFAGSEYLDSSIVLKILMIALFFMLFGGNLLGNVILLPSRKEKSFMVYCIISTIINVITNCFFIPKLGALGAAITTAISEIVLLLLLFCKKDKKIRIDNIFRIMFPPIVGCCVIVLICFVFSHLANVWIRIVVSVSVSVISYFAVQMVMKNKLILEILRGIGKKFLRKG
ncbi:Membrane protein involved in the export of O-antigen and teichoic acid [Ruminococcaceae bacterium FB2012]|nr:Membrane protein involved in the export of O-antigen and teichoic acid [Ruminococcaceae bacterium FB2012]